MTRVSNADIDGSGVAAPDLPATPADFSLVPEVKITLFMESFGQRYHGLVSPSGMVETSRLQAKNKAAKSTKLTSQRRLCEAT
jgi:hypothetical protein